MFSDRSNNCNNTLRGKGVKLAEDDELGLESLKVRFEVVD